MNASHKRARHALCNMIQSLGYTLNVKLWRLKKENKHCTSKVTLRHTNWLAVSWLQYRPGMALLPSASCLWNWKPCSWHSQHAADEAFPDTYLTACDLHCSGANAAWHAMLIHVTWSDLWPGYFARFRNLMPSLRARHAAGMGYTLQYCSQDYSRASTDHGLLTHYMRGGAFDGTFKALCTSWFAFMATLSQRC